jgi:hypothetical protein
MMPPATVDTLARAWLRLIIPGAVDPRSTGCSSTGDAVADAAAVLKAIRAGQLYTAINAWASPPAFEFSATNHSGTAHQGESLSGDGPVALHVRSNAPAGYLTTVWRDGQVVSEKVSA